MPESTNKKYYRPLPDSLTILKSKIEGLGLYSTNIIEGGRILGIAHVYNEEFEDNYIRTPIGGFINYSNTPNCYTTAIDNQSKNLSLVTLREIQIGEELTLKYHMYDPTQIE